ncbi:MAG: CDP-2,3-bis-(O-geranylgeranyl)-sn-glycerol synthase [bacterium]
MKDLIIQSVYLVLPAYFANMAPVIFDKLKLLKFLAHPIDGGAQWRGDFVFGKNKTWRGIVSAVIMAVMVTGLQAVLMNQEYFRAISLIDYQSLWLVFGILAGLGAILGDLLKSFFKRRFKIASGSSWLIFDQLDFIAGFFIFTYFLFLPPFRIVVTVFVLTLVLHPLTNLLAYLLKIKKVWW